MAEVLPSINCAYKDSDAVAARCKAVGNIFDTVGARAAARWAHFDVADGLFTFHKSWDEPERLKAMQLPFAFEAHLMAEDPAAAAERWISAGARRVIVHAESATPAVFSEIAATATAAGSEIALALNPETPAAAALPYAAFTSRFLILGVHPGLSGQKFLPIVLEKISALRRAVPDATIAVDGGMNAETARAAIAAGAIAIVSGSDIFGSTDPEGEYM